MQHVDVLDAMVLFGVVAVGVLRPTERQLMIGLVGELTNLCVRSFGQPTFPVLFERDDAAFRGGIRPDGSCPRTSADTSSVGRSAGHRTRHRPGGHVPPSRVATGCQ
jgi:hypothetical protein